MDDSPRDTIDLMEKLLEENSVWDDLNLLKEALEHDLDVDVEVIEWNGNPQIRVECIFDLTVNRDLLESSNVYDLLGPMIEMIQFLKNGR